MMNSRLKVKIHAYELILLAVITINLLFFLVDSFYNSFSSSISYVFIIAGILMALSSRKFSINWALFVEYALLVLSAFLIVKLNGSGSGVVLQLIWPLALIVILHGRTLSNDFFVAVAWISKIFILCLTAKTLFLYRGAADMSLFLTRNGYVNANSTGMLILYLFWFSTIENQKIGLHRSEFFWAMIAAVGIWNTGARTALLVFGSTLFIQTVFESKLRRNRKLLLIVLLGTLAVGIAVPFLYVMLFQANVANSAVFLGKNVFTGRELIWINVFNYYLRNPIAYLIGTGYNDTFYIKGSFNLHNAYLMLAAQYGLIITIWYFSCVLRVLWKSYDTEEPGPLKMKMIFIVFATMLMGITEVSFSWVPTLIFPGIALGILNNERMNA